MTNALGIDVLGWRWRLFFSNLYYYDSNNGNTTMNDIGKQKFFDELPLFDTKKTEYDENESSG